ncbi:MAG TPA: hypothetical protein DCE42_18820 [Myxococcales bacterium]|nr:hypothetical protein [Deltaproteobacteria bacterium]HAA56827.1 hypothetical protein [Myxococcales bacterium]
MDNNNQGLQGTQLLKRAFEAEQECLRANLKSSNRITHCGDRGEVNEQFFIDVLRAYLPNRYTVEKAIVIDSTGAVSHSIDIVIFDRQYTPTLFDNQKHRYVPAEAVYAVFECKSKINKSYLEYAGDKVESVRKLKRTSVKIPHAGGVYPERKLFPIIGGILAIDLEWDTGLGSTFEENHKKLQGDKHLDCGFTADGHYFDVFNEDNSYKTQKGADVLAFFVFRLLWKLQRMATVPAVDWMAYATNFRS